MTFGEKLAEARKEKGLSQEALAKQIFVTRQALSRWENNTAQPSLGMLSVLCDILEKSPDYFIGGDRHPTRSYQALTRNEKRMLWTQWRPNDGHYGLKCFLLDLLLNIGIFLLTLIICNCYVTGLWDLPEVGRLFLLIGTLLWILSAVLMLALLSLHTSMRYNLWLRETHSIIRTNKFFLI